MKYIDAERLRAEIEKERKKALDSTKRGGLTISDIATADVLAEVLLIIEQLKKEQPEVDLEKEIERWWGEKYMKNSEGLPILPIVQGIARHFAEWQSKQDKETIELAEDHAYLAGSVNEREQMMKEAVEGVVQFDDHFGRKYVDVSSDKFGCGDKVRIIIVKED